MSDAILRASEWCYQGVWLGLTKWMLVPKEPPTLPARSGEHLASFRPSEGYLNYLRFFFWIGLVAIDIALTIGWIAIAFASPLIGFLITPLALAVIVLPDIVAYIALHLRYDTTWYVLTDRSMRIRRGIWKIHETTITFENIQNIRLSQGPVQRYFGFANLIVETAGGGGGAAGQPGSAGAHIGIMEGLDNATEIRNMILAHLKKSPTSGLGDEVHRTESHPSIGLDSVDLQLLREIRDLTARLIA